jgi:hypothetical protein
MEDIAIWDNMWYFGGRTTNVGFGRMDGYFEKYSVDGEYLGGLFAATDRDEQFECIIVNADGIVLCGSFETEDLGEQAAIMLYRRPTVYSDTLYAPLALDCFVVEVEENQADNQPTYAVVDVLDLQGRVIRTSMKFSQLQSIDRRNSGIYIIRDTATGACKKVFID